MLNSPSCFPWKVINVLLSSGPHIESYLAEEAVGLARSLDWDIIKGPFWGKEDDKCIILVLNIDDPVNWNSDSDIIPEESYSVYRKYRKQKDENKNAHKVRDGDYIYTDGMQGVYYVILINNRKEESFVMLTMLRRMRRRFMINGKMSY